MPYAPSMTPPRPALAAPTAPADRAERSILIVDDDESIRWLFSDCLGARYYCTTAANAEEALALLAREGFALVLADVSMPGLSGVELLRRVVAQYPDTAVVMISGVDRTQRVLDAVRIGAFDYLIKPIDLDVLELSVERALERRKLLNDARRYKQDLERRNAELARRLEDCQHRRIVLDEKDARAHPRVTPCAPAGRPSAWSCSVPEPPGKPTPFGSVKFVPQLAARS